LVNKEDEEPSFEAIDDDRSTEKYYMQYFDEINLLWVKPSEKQNEYL